MSKALKVLLGVALAYSLCKLLFCYTLIRVPIAPEYVLSHKHCRVTMLNPFKVGDVRHKVENFFDRLPNSNAVDTVKKARLQYLFDKTRYSIMDVYTERDRLLVFINFNKRLHQDGGYFKAVMVFDKNNNAYITW